MVTFTGDVPPLVSHYAHPHMLKLVGTGDGFRCDGCNLPGRQEHRYRCELCNFDLHVCCARAPAPTTTTVQIAPTRAQLLAAMQYAAPMRKRDIFMRFCKISYRVVNFGIAIATMDPAGVIQAFAD